MKQINMYSYYDKKSQRYDTPFFSFNHLFAERSFRILADKEGTMMSKFTHDFELYQIGVFDNETGQFEYKKEFVIDGISIKKEG